MECVGRSQGLILPKGNPKGIQEITDLAGLNYVNRQKGSGTRILCDYLFQKLGMEPASVKGYDREEFTHTAVAAASAAGTADAGFGILSAARIYGLDFIPVYDEQYDLLVAEDALELEMVRRLVEVIQGEEFAGRLQALGGYTLKEPGRIIPWR